MTKYLTFSMPDNSYWGVPVDIIARDRAKQYASEFGGDIERSLAEDTLPLFQEDEWAIEDWAQNNMNWSDVVAHAKMLGPPQVDESEFQEAWVNADKAITEVSE